MVSDIILYQGKSSYMENEDSCFVGSSIAYLTEDYAGVRVEKKDKDDVIDSHNTGKRSILAAIRGSILAQETKYIDDDFASFCFHAFNNDESINKTYDFDVLQKKIDRKRLLDIQNFVPSNIENVLTSLIDRDFPFRGREIQNEIQKGNIKNNSSIKEILHINNQLALDIDAFEYGWDAKISDLRTILNTSFRNYANIFRPLSDTFFRNYEQGNARGISYGSINLAGIYILSKMKENRNLNLDLSINLTREYTGDIKELNEKVCVHSFIRFKKSDKNINKTKYTKKTLQKIKGKNEEFTIRDKIPFLYMPCDASLILLTDDIACAVPKNYEYEGDVWEMHGEAQRRRNFINEYTLPGDN